MKFVGLKDLKEVCLILNFTCDQCDFATTRFFDLKRHQIANHEGRTDNNAIDPVFIETSNTEIKKEEITEEDPLSDTVSDTILYVSTGDDVD